MIACGEHVGPKLEELVANCRRDSETACGVLNINYQQLDLVRLNQMLYMFAHNLASRAAEDIADKENLHSSG